MKRPDRGVSQPASSSGVSQPAVIKELIVGLNFGTFNVGIDQHMLTATRKSNKNVNNLKRVIAKAVETEELSLLMLCEVGGHRQGLAAAGIPPDDIITDALSSDFAIDAVQAYIGIYQTKCATSGLVIERANAPKIVCLTSPALDPQLAIFQYVVRLGEHWESALVIGNLHIRTPTGQKVPSVTTKQRICRNALEAIEHFAESSVFQPAVCILCGDSNLDQNAADVICQRDSGPVTVDTCWHTEAADFGLGGDVLWVKGAETARFDITIGRSYEDRGVRRDRHDAFGARILMSMPLVSSEPLAAQKRRKGGSASRSAGVRPAADSSGKAEEKQGEEETEKALPAPAADSSGKAGEHQGEEETEEALPAPAADSSGKAGEQQGEEETEKALPAPAADSSGKAEEKQGEGETGKALPAPAADSSGKAGEQQGEEETEEDLPAPAADSSGKAKEQQGEGGPRNALTHNVAESLLQRCRDWYKEHLDDGCIHAKWQLMHQLLFKKKNAPMKERTCGSQTPVFLSPVCLWSCLRNTSRCKSCKSSRLGKRG